MFFPFLAFTAFSLSLIKLGSLLVWVEVLASVIKLAALTIVLLTLTLLWQTLRRR